MQVLFIYICIFLCMWALGSMYFYSWVHMTVCVLVHLLLTICCVTQFVCKKHLLLWPWHAEATHREAKESFVWVQNASDVLEEMYIHLACVTILQSSLQSTLSRLSRLISLNMPAILGSPWAHPVHSITTFPLHHISPMPRRWFLLPTVFWVPFPPQSRLSSVFSLEPVLIQPSSLLVACPADSTQPALGCRQ